MHEGINMISLMNFVFGTLLSFWFVLVGKVVWKAIRLVVDVDGKSWLDWTYLCDWIVAAISATLTILRVHWISAEILLQSRSPNKYTSSAHFCAWNEGENRWVWVEIGSSVINPTCFSNISEGQFVTWLIRSARKNLDRLGVRRFNLFEACDDDKTLGKLLTPAPS